MSGQVMGSALTQERGYPLAARISSQMVQLVSRHTGRGPTKVRTTLNTNLALVLYEDALTRAESNLVAAGEIESVCEQRRTFDRLMRSEAIAIVEEAAGRRVRAFLSDISPADGVAMHTFVFESRPETGRAEVGESDER